MDNGLPQPVQIVAGDGKRVLTLAGVINIIAADALLASARELVAGTGPVEVECREAEYFDVSALQILLALERELARQGRGMRLLHLSEQAARDLALAGLEREFDHSVASANCRTTVAGITEIAT